MAATIPEPLDPKPKRLIMNFKIQAEVAPIATASQSRRNLPADCAFLAVEVVGKGVAFFLIMAVIIVLMGGYFGGA